MAMITPNREIELSPTFTRMSRSRPMEIWPNSGARGHQEQNKKDQVIEHAVAYGFAKRIERNGGKAGGHELTASFSVVLDRK